MTPSVLWRCWLGGRKGIRPVKNWVVRCWHVCCVVHKTCSYLSGARCRLAYGPADAIATHCLCFSKIQIGLTFLVPAHLGSPGKRAIKRAYFGRPAYKLLHEIEFFSNLYTLLLSRPLLLWFHKLSFVDPALHCMQTAPINWLIELWFYAPVDTK